MHYRSWHRSRVSSMIYNVILGPPWKKTTITLVSEVQKTKPHKVRAIVIPRSWILNDFARGFDVKWRCEEWRKRMQCKSTLETVRGLFVKFSWRRHGFKLFLGLLPRSLNHCLDWTHIAQCARPDLYLTKYSNIIIIKNATTRMCSI